MYTKQKHKLERRNAFKNVDYDASVSSSSSSSLSSSSLFDIQSAHQSVDILSLSDTMSYRINDGNDGEVEFICRSLGFCGPEDLAISAADWEAHKTCSPSSLFSKESLVNDFESINDNVSIVKSNSEIDSLLKDGCLEGKSRIKGDRPPLLARPSRVMPQMNVDELRGLSWDLRRGFDPVISKNAVEIVVKHDDDDEEEEENVGCIENKGIECFVSPNGTVRCSLRNWQKGDFLGSGSFGTVYEGFNEHGFFFAVKEVSLLDQGTQGKQSISQLQQEIFLLSQFQHDNIVRYLGTDKDDGKLYIFLELVPKGSLANLYHMYHLRDSQVSTYTRQILSGLTYLHERNVVHRDIKCANILVDVSGSVKLADFGLAKASKLNDINSCKGTPYWMAPEVVNNWKNKGYGPAADIWSLGCTVLEMLTRRVPYSHLEGMQALFRIGRGERPMIPETLSAEARDFIFKCLQVNPNDRPTAAKLLKHPFVKTPVCMNLSPVSPLCSGRRP
uniref:mitogen-activated protein kinase kinase kinase 1-like n=1 Tax=Erigeron canadensis TaxID=72917 RepID=UPI001CB96D2F|nr:mitogen-activated protein kinase kinase kinase 1-like [Erigeron canadensis]